MQIRNIHRALKIVFSGIVGLYTAVLVFNNLSDYNANFEFVRMVAMMDDVFPESKNTWRHIDSPILHHAFYISIVIFELLIAVLLLLGAYRMAKTLNAGADLFSQAKQYTTLGFSLGVFLWFFVFITVGGEWYLMWQSEKWNAQENAFFLTICFMLFLNVHLQQGE